MNDDPACDNYLTLGHFLIGCAPISSLDSMLIDSRPARGMWNDYLVEVQGRCKGTLVTAKPKVGDIVLVSHENFPALRWALARNQQ